jgi:hypothetical protein
MAKKGSNPFEKQSSTISNAQVLSLMAKYNFAVQTLPKPVEEKKSVGSAVRSAKRQFGQFAHISNSGESVFFQGQHVENKCLVSDIRVKLSNMVGLGELEALYKATGIPQLNPNPERRMA